MVLAATRVCVTCSRLGASPVFPVRRIAHATEPGTWGSWCAKIETAGGSAAFASELVALNGRNDTSVEANVDGSEWRVVHNGDVDIGFRVWDGSMDVEVLAL